MAGRASNPAVQALAEQEARAKALPCMLTEMCAEPATVSVMIEGRRVNGCLTCYHEHNANVLRNWSDKQSAAQREAHRARVRKLLWGATK